MLIGTQKYCTAFAPARYITIGRQNIASVTTIDVVGLWHLLDMKSSSSAKSINTTVRRINISTRNTATGMSINHENSAMQRIDEPIPAVPYAERI